MFPARSKSPSDHSQCSHHLEISFSSTHLSADAFKKLISLKTVKIKIESKFTLAQPAARMQPIWVVQFEWMLNNFLRNTTIFATFKRIFVHQLGKIKQNVNVWNFRIFFYVDALVRQVRRRLVHHNCRYLSGALWRSYFSQARPNFNPANQQLEWSIFKLVSVKLEWIEC